MESHEEIDIKMCGRPLRVYSGSSAASAGSMRVSDEKLREWQKRYVLEGLTLNEIRTMVDDASTLHLA